jgi:hypothetical protein
MNKLTYVAASNYRPTNYQDTASAVITFNKKTRQWEEGPNGSVATYRDTNDFRQVANREMQPGITVFRIFPR